MKIFLTAVLIVISASLLAGEMVYIPSGPARIGLTEQQVRYLASLGADPVWFKNCTPQFSTDLDAYYIDRYEVTNSEYHEFDPTHFFQDLEADMPVTGITWTDACEYAAWAEKRLPSEFEWEKAARGAFGRVFPWGDNADFTRAYSKGIKVPGFNGLVSVRLFNKDISSYGVMDMGGNACEWTASVYDQYEGNKTFNRKYGKDFRVIKGGSFLYHSLEAFCANRKCGKPGLRNIDIGFRCAMSVDDYIKKYGRQKHLQNLRSQAEN